MVKFGVAGNSDSFFEQGYTQTLQAAEWCADRGLDLFEYSFGRGIRMSEGTARELGAEFARLGVELSVHAPYYINFAVAEEEKAQLSINYVLKCMEILNYFGTRRVVVHPASQSNFSREEAVSLTKANLELLARAIIASNHTDKIVCIETMGKTGQIGTVEEVMEFCSVAPFFYPCIDFGHINAREQGVLSNTGAFENIFNTLLQNLPREKVENLHIHFSKIEYGVKGELRHLTFEDSLYGPDPAHLLEAVYNTGLSPHIICESKGTQAEDSVFMKNYYNQLISHNQE
jgi:deoxyribonuclease-4